MGATLTSNQVICSGCEEAVHRFASRCPYCNTAIQAAQSVASFETQPTPSKITHLTQPEPFHKIASTPSEEEFIESEETSPFSLFLSLIMLLGGSFFLFFGLMVKLFSKNGRFTLEWSADSWAYFLFPALILLFLGLLSLTSSSPQDPEEQT